MPLSVKWILLWGTLFTVLLIYLNYPSTTQSMPFPSTITHISVNTTHLNLILNNRQQWQSTGATVNSEQQKLIQHWINDLQTGCSEQFYPKDSINNFSPQDNFAFSINKIPYSFGTFNTYAKRHYLYHDGQAYLCLPTLRPRLENAHHIWITYNA